jgi:hypothetical protein
MNILKIVLAICIVAVIGALAGYHFVYNKPHTNYEEASPAFTLQAQDFYQAFTEDREQAEETYNGKVIEFTGTLDILEDNQDFHTAVFVFDDGLFGPEGIRCTMLDNHTENLAGRTGEIVQIKGFCSGFSGSDVIMEHCSVIL